MTRALAIALACAVGFFTACSDKKASEPQEDDVILASNTRIPETNPDFQGATVTGNSVTLTYSSTPPTFNEDDIIVGTDDGGYLRRVSSVSVEDNSVTLQTTQAAMNEAASRLVIDTTIGLTPQASGLDAINIDTTLVGHNGESLPYKARLGRCEVVLMGDLFMLRWPNVSITIADLLSVQMDTLTLTSSLDFDLTL